MEVPHNSLERMSSNQFASINRKPNSISYNNEEKRTKTILKDQSAHNSMQPTSDKDHRNRKRTRILDSTSSSATNRESGSAARRLFLWCTQCFRRRKPRKDASRKSKGFWKRLREKCRKRKRRLRMIKEQRKRSRVKEYRDSVREISEKRRRGSERVKRVEDLTRPRESSYFEPRKTIELDEKPSRDSVSIKDDLDFTKSCCYLCAKNTMAIASALSNRIEKAHISIQSSIQYLQEDKSCSPVVQVRTVKSSVKVKTRDMSTLHTDGKKSKKPIFKSKLKKLNILPKIKPLKYPKMKTVACETEKFNRRGTVPQCKAKRGTNCVTQNK